MSIDGTLNGLLKLAIVAAVIGGGALGAVAVLNHMTLDSQAAERRALLQRKAELNNSAVAPGSALACLDGGAGEAIENACEKSIFAGPQSAAGAVAYTAARLALLADAHAFSRAGQSDIMEAFAATRRAIELDRYGLAAHVLATRDGCTAERCAAFTWLRDTAALKGNLKGQAFDTYVARYAANWNKVEPEKQAPVASAPTAAPTTVSSAPGTPSGQPVSSKYDFPSSASIPAVSIMNAEPPLPKEATEAQAAQPKADSDSAVPIPPKRPQGQATTPPTR